MDLTAIHIGELEDTIPTHLGELVGTVLKEKLMFSLANDLVDLKTPEVKMMQRYFERVKNFPEYLVTHNNVSVQRAYLAVPQEVWMQRVLDLQQALQSFRNGEIARRSIVTQSPLEEVLPIVRNKLDKAFISKYEELMLRVKNDFEDFFPYSIDSTNPQLMVFKKMSRFELIEYVMRRF